MFGYRFFFTTLRFIQYLPWPGTAHYFRGNRSIYIYIITITDWPWDVNCGVWIFNIFNNNDLCVSIILPCCDIAGLQITIHLLNTLSWCLFKHVELLWLCLTWYIVSHLWFGKWICLNFLTYLNENHYNKPK